MGVDGLHSVLKAYSVPSHVRELAGHRVGVDASSWLHRGAVSAAPALLADDRPWEKQGRDAPYVSFAWKMTNTLREAGVIPVLVFDGCRLPAKAATNAARRRRREEARERAARLRAEGRDQEAEAVLMQCIGVTPEMGQELIVKLRQHGVAYCVAPYEADSQLAFLASLPEAAGGVAAVVTEDSDLVAYGVPRLLFKMDAAGYCLHLRLQRLFEGPPSAAAGDGDAGTAGTASAAGGASAASAVSGATVASSSRGGGGGKGSSKGGSGGGKGQLSFQGWTLDMLQAACVLAGCDYQPSLKGISFRTAAGFVGRRRSLEGALKAIQLEKRWRLLATHEYCEGARKAELAFRHAIVFSAAADGGSCVRLAPAGGELPEGELEHTGALLEPEVARGIAHGRLHPHTLEPYPPPAVPPPQPQPLRSSQQWRQQQQHSQQQLWRPQHSQQQSQQQRQQVGWLAAGAVHHAPQQQQQQQHGPAGSQVLPPQMLRRLEQQWEGAPLHRSQPPAPPQQGVRSLFMRQQPSSTSGSPAASQPAGTVLQPLDTNRQQPVMAATQASAACSGGSPAEPAAAPGAASQAASVWDRREQHASQPAPAAGAWSTPPAAAGSKRRADFSRSAPPRSGKKQAKQAKQAPPGQQRISRFFAPAPAAAAAQKKG